MKAHRLARVSEVVREVAAEAILFELKDPRIKNVTVTRAEVSGDLQHTKVFVSVMGTEKEQKLTMHGLQAAAGYVQTRLAKRLTSRYVPHVTFVLDEGVKKSIEIARLIREEQARRGEEPTAEAELDEVDDEEEDDEEGEVDPATPPARDEPADGSADR